MLLNKLNQLKAARAKVASLEKSIENKLNRELAALPEKYGFETAAEPVSYTHLRAHET